MAKREDKATSATVKPGAMPYEHLLVRAFDKLSSEIFVFLLAYVMVLIGFAVVAPAVSASFSLLLHVLPIVGVAAYVWLRSAGLAKQATANGVDIWSGIAIGSARVTGVAGAVARTLGRVKVRSVLAAGSARVTAVDAGGNGEADGNEERYLLDQFRKLDETARRAVVDEVHRLLKPRPAGDG